MSEIRVPKLSEGMVIRMTADALGNWDVAPASVRLPGQKRYPLSKSRRQLMMLLLGGAVHAIYRRKRPSRVGNSTAAALVPVWWDHRAGAFRFLDRVSVDKSAAAMIRKGVLVRSKAFNDVELYELAPSLCSGSILEAIALENPQEPIPIIEPQPKATWAHVEALAEKHGCYISRVPSIKAFRLERIDGEPLAEPYIPGVYQIMDLCLDGWDEAIRNCVKLNEKQSQSDV